MEFHDITGFSDHLPDIAPFEIVFLGNAAHQGCIRWRHLNKHSFLRFGKHNLNRTHIRFALVYTISMDQTAKRAAHLAGSPGKPGGPEISAGKDLPRLCHLEDGLNEQLFRERIPYLDTRAVLSF